MVRPSILLAALVVTVPAVVHAADSTVVANLDFAYKNLTLTPGNNSGGFNTTLITLNPGLAIAYQRVYLSLNYDKSIDSDSTTQLENGGYPSMLTMSRTDTVFTLGFRVTDYLSLFAGWLNGEIGVYINGARFTGGTAIFYTQEISYVENGPFAGLALSHAFGNKGSLSFSMAYAKLNGELTQTRYFGSTPPGLDYSVLTSDVKGLSYGLTWSGNLTGSLNYRIGAKATRYDGDETIETPGGISERYTMVFFGLSNQF